MSKIIFVGDTHIVGISPSSRKESNEQYREVILNKLEFIRQTCINEGANICIIEGDVFNNNTGITNTFESEIWLEFLKFKENNIQLYTIIGNHDMFFQNEQEFKGTYLYKAFLAGMIKHLDELNIGPITIKGIDFKKDFISISELNQIGSYNILVGHCFYENECFGGIGNENLTDEKCRTLGYNAYVLGHDHTPYPEIDTGIYKVIRTGALMRGTSKTCNLYRKVNVACFDLLDFSWKEIEIPTKPGLEVFIEKAVLSKDIDLNLEKLLENFSASKDTNIYSIIDSHREQGQIALKEKYQPVENLIVKYLESLGIYRRIDEINN